MKTGSATGSVGLVSFDSWIAQNLRKGAIPNRAPLGKGQGRKEVR